MLFSCLTHVNQTDLGSSWRPYIRRYCSNHVRTFYLQFRHPMLSACLWSNSRFQLPWKESTYSVYSGPLLSSGSPGHCLISFSPSPQLPVLSLEEMKRRRKERDSLPWGALARQRSRLSELPVILYMHWMGLRCRVGGFVVYSSSLFVCIFSRLYLLHSPSCTQKYEICSPAVEGVHGAIWQTEDVNNTSPGWYSQEWSLSSSSKWLSAFWEPRLDPSVSLAMC